MKRLICALLSLVLLFALAACGGGKSNDAPSASTAPATSSAPPADSGEKITVSIQFSFPEMQARSTQAILDKITADSGGRVQFETYYSFSLYGPPDVVGALQDGLLDMAGFMTSEYPGLFPLNGLLMGLPFLGFRDISSATAIYRDLVVNYEPLRKEMEDAGIIYYSGWVLPPYQLHSMGNAAITEPDFSGLTMMTENGFMQKMINKYGGAGMLSFPPDFYSNLSNGVADGIVNHLNVLSAFGCLELIKNTTIFGDGGIYVYPLNYGISPSFWNSLPDDIKAIFLKYADELTDAGLEYDLQMLVDNAAFLEENANVIHLSDAEIAAWKAAFEDTRVEALAELSAANPAAEETYNKLLDAIKNYK